MGNVLTSTDSRMLLTLTEAAESVGYSPDTLRRATKATDPSKFPPPLKCKREKRDKDGNPSGPIKIRPADLAAWVDSLPDG